jgi:hypothetical protein
VENLLAFCATRAKLNATQPRIPERSGTVFLRQKIQVQKSTNFARGWLAKRREIPHRQWMPSCKTRRVYFKAAAKPSVWTPLTYAAAVCCGEQQANH